METIQFDDFKKVEIRIGKILSAEKLPDSNKLLKLEVDFGATTSAQGSGESREKRIILSGIAKFYTPEQIIGKLCPFVVNLLAKKIGELESQGMILCADGIESGPVLLHPDKEVNPGSIVK